MKLVFFLLLSFLTIAQQKSFKPCDSLIINEWKYQYYSFNAKYPLSSEKLTEEVNEALVYQPKQKQINGFVTIRFVVNCQGQIGDFEIYQINNHYQNTKFEEKYIESLLEFIKNLENWKIAIYKDKNYDYYTYFTFKIEHGKVTEIVP